MKEQIDMEGLIAKVEDWGRERGLDKADPLVQYTKLLEEVSELGRAIVMDDRAEQEDAIGDIMVVLTMLCMQLDINDLEYCLRYRNLIALADENNFRECVKNIKAFEGFLYRDSLDSTPFERFVKASNYVSDIGMALLDYDKTGVLDIVRVSVNTLGNEHISKIEHYIGLCLYELAVLAIKLDISDIRVRRSTVCLLRINHDE